MKDLIFLCGFMGCGKSTVGKILAQILNCDFYDTDATVEKMAGKSISEIFEQAGESYFRTLESQAILEIPEKPRSIVALGGGSLLSENNLQYVLSHGRLVYLRADMSLLESRLLKNSSRPLLKTSSMPDLFRLRETGYLKAHIILDDRGSTPAEIAEKIVTVLNSHA